MGNWIFVSVLIAFSFIAAVFITYETGYDRGAHTIKQEALEKEYAQYNPKTGEWEWKETDENEDNR